MKRTDDQRVVEKSKGIKIALAIAFLFLTSFAIAFPTMFSTFASYDDEGYVMMTLRTYMDGHRLYGDTYTQYGPAYYLITAPLHSVFDLPLSHDAVRMKSIVVWLVVTGCSWFLIYRFSRSIVYATVIAMFVAIQLRKLSLEPGHPQELALLGTMGVAICIAFFLEGPVFSKGIVFSKDTDKLRGCILAPALAGLFAAICGWTKLNSGIVTAIPLLACTAVFASCKLTGLKSYGIARALRMAVYVGVLLPGLGIAWSGRSDFYEVTWAFSGTLAALVFVGQYASQACDEPLIPSSFLISLHPKLSCMTPAIAVVSSAMLCSSIIIGIVLAQGVSSSELWYGVVGQHQNFANQFFQPVRPQSWLFRETFFAAALLSLAVYSTKSNENRESLKRWIVILVCMIFCSCSAATLFRPLTHGLEPLASGHLLAMVGPWLIFYLFRFREPSNSLGLFGLGLLGIMSPWIAFPVAGTQVELGTVPTLVAIGIGLWEWRNSRSFDRASYQWLFFQRIPRYGSVAAGCLLASAIWMQWGIYRANTALALPGAMLFRLPEEVVFQEHRVVDEINRISTSSWPPIEYLAFEGHNNNRFYFWTGLKPLTATNPTFWPRMITPAQELRIVRAIAESPGTCVVRVPDYRLLTGDRARESTQWIESHYQEESRLKGLGNSDWQIGYTRNQPLASNQLLKFTKASPAEKTQDRTRDQHHDIHQRADHLEWSQGRNTQNAKSQIHKEEQGN